MSLSEPDPQVAVNLGAGPALLGHPMKLRDEEGESPVEFTLRLLEELVDEANGVAAAGVDAAAAQLDPHAPVS